MKVVNQFQFLNCNFDRNIQHEKEMGYVFAHQVKIRNFFIHLLPHPLAKEEERLLTEAHTSIPKKPTRSTKSRTHFLSFVHKLWSLREVNLSSSSTSSNSSSSGSFPDKRAARYHISSSDCSFKTTE